MHLSSAGELTMPPEEQPQPSTTSSTTTGALEPPTEPTTVRLATRPIQFRRDLLLRTGELTILLVAVVGAIALGLGITDYFAEHRKVLGYLIAYAGFRYADLMIRQEFHEGPAREELSRRIFSQLPLLLMFAGAAFERTYIYRGRVPHWSGGLGITLAIIGLWLALASRIQLGFLSTTTSDQPVLVQSWLFRYIRHPNFLGVFLMLIGWPLIYGAPIAFVLTATIAWLSLRRQIIEEERSMLTRFGEQYESYMRRTGAMIPNIW
jgi:protein-S-isoprenylcysteine O-methyltransferase Ste14